MLDCLNSSILYYSTVTAGRINFVLRFPRLEHVNLWAPPLGPERVNPIVPALGP